jgi:hypothetical protein
VYSDQLHADLVSLNAMTPFELKIIKDITDSYLSITQDSNLDLSEYYQLLSNNEDLLLQDGEFVYTLLAIMEHSYCHWTTLEGIQTRWSWNPIRIIADALGAYGGGVYNLIETNAHHDPEIELFAAMGTCGSATAAISSFWRR